MSRFLLGLLLSAIWIAGTIAANITIDDTDPGIIYLPPGPDVWLHVPTQYATDRYRNTTTYCQTQGCTASLNFTGATAIYFGGYGEVDTNTGTFEVSFNGAVTNVAGNVSPDSPRAQQILFSKTDLDPDKVYNITLRKTSPSKENDLNVDFFTFTYPDPVTTTTGSKTGSATGPTTSLPKKPTGTPEPGTTAPPSNLALQTMSPAEIGGIVAGIVVGLALATIIWLVIRRRRRRGGGVTLLDGSKLDLDGERDVEPVPEAGITPFWPRYSDYAHPSAGGPEAGGDIEPSHATSSYGASNAESESVTRLAAGTEVAVPLLLPPPSYEAAGGSTSPAAAALLANPNRKQ